MANHDAEVLAQQLLGWPAADRAHLAELLIESLERSTTESEAAWNAEIDRRATALDSGRIQCGCWAGACRNRPTPWTGLTGRIADR